MTLEELQIAQKEVSDKYSKLQAQKESIEVELLRLQGEYRAYQRQIDIEIPTKMPVKNKLGKNINE